MKHIILSICAATGIWQPLSAQMPSAEQVLSKSIAHHDPAGDWETTSHELTLRETRPNGPDRMSKIKLDLAGEHFRIQRESDGHQVVHELSKDEISHTLDGRSTSDTAAIAKHRLSDDRAQMMKNYYLYLYGLPMKLNDPGSHIDPQVVSEKFNQIDAWKIKVTYDPNVGDDIWYFYFAKKDHRLVGYRFFHDEAANDGEYITLEDEAKVGKLILPKKRSWYMNKDDRYLGSDIIVNNK